MLTLGCKDELMLDKVYQGMLRLVEGLLRFVMGLPRLTKNFSWVCAKNSSQSSTEAIS